ncbi:MAG: lipopolysaccharide biosynthesis protein [Candidatus Eisenbacteria bacterium]
MRSSGIFGSARSAGPRGAKQGDRILERNDRHLRTDGLQEDLRGRSIRGGAATMAAQAGRFALTVGSTMILARILTPRDFGLIAMVVAVMMFLVILRDLGLPTATVQQAVVTQEQVSTLFWLNGLLGLAVAVITIILAPLLVRFYGEPALLGITPLFGVVSLIDALSLQHRALLRRRMRFGALAAVELFSQLVGVAAAVATAWKGGRFWSLLVLRLVTASVQTLLCWRICDWRPDRRFRPAEVRGMIAFGGYLSGSRLVRSVGRNLDRILIGRFTDARLLGLYAKAAGWLVAPFQQLSFPVARVAVPVLSRLQDEPDRYRRYWRQGMLLMTTLGMPVICFLVLDTRKVIYLLLGDQWEAAIPIFRILSPVALVTLLHMGTGWAYVSLGRAARQLRWEIAATAVTAAAFLIGIKWGPAGVAAGFSIASGILLLPGALYCFRGSPIRMSDFYGTIGRPAAAALLAGGGLALLMSLDGYPGSPLSALWIDLPLFLALDGIGWIVVPGGRRVLTDLARLLRDLRKNNRKPGDTIPNS